MVKEWYSEHQVGMEVDPPVAMERVVDPKVDLDVDPKVKMANVKEKVEMETWGAIQQQ